MCLNYKNNANMSHRPKSLLLGSVLRLQCLLLLLCALYGLVFVLGKLTLEYASPLFITAARMTLAGLLLLAYQYIFHRKQFHIPKKLYRPIFIAGFTNIYLTNALEFWGLQFMEAAKACFLYSFCPIATALLSYFWFNEKITYQKWIGLLIGISGFLPVLIAHSGQEDVSGYFFFFSYSELAILGAALTASIGWMTMRVIVKGHGFSSAMANASTMLVGGIFALIHSLGTENWNPSPVADFFPFLGWFLSLTLVSNLISYNLNAYLLRFFTATYTSFAGLSQPFFAALFGWLLLHEVMSLHFWISLAAVSFGLYIYYREELKQGYMPVKPARKA